MKVARFISIASAISALAVILLSNAAIGENGIAILERDPVQEKIERILDGKGKVAGIGLRSISHLKQFYANRGFAPAWFDRERVSKQGEELIEVIDSMDLEGLSPGFYHREQIGRLIADTSESGDKGAFALAEADILFTDAFFLLASNLSSGIAYPFSRKTAFFKPRDEIDLAATLEGALATNSIRRAIGGLKPSLPEYRLLRDELARYRQTAANGGWPTLPQPPKLPKDEKIQVGWRNPWVANLRRRLEATEVLKRGPVENDDFFDNDVEKAVTQFQKRHGLNDDGVVGKNTFDALNVTAEERVCQIMTNLDRLRALSQALGESKYILVNIPAFKLDVVENGKSSLDMKIIVGTGRDKSPLMTDTMETIVFSPKWHVPESIAAREEFKKLKDDPKAFKRRGMRVYSGTGRDRVELDYEQYDWSGVDTVTLEYKIVQDPGAGNALGRIKFLFPNSDNVYLHDTPTKPLFQKDVRMFSHGCIRIEKPFELAELLLKSDERWPRERIDKAAFSGKELFVNLPEKVPIYLVYLTAWADGDGNVRFRGDVYGYDREMARIFCGK